MTVVGPTDWISENGLIIFRWVPFTIQSDISSSTLEIVSGRLTRSTRPNAECDFSVFVDVGFMMDDEVDAYLTKTCPGITFDRI